ncbi:hypothetical protein GQ457_14G020910 [Hibiscus cannabinus]
MHITVKRRTPDVDISQSTTVSGSIESGHNPSLNIKFERLTQRTSVPGVSKSTFKDKIIFKLINSSFGLELHKTDCKFGLRRFELVKNTYLVKVNGQTVKRSTVKRINGTMGPHTRVGSTNLGPLRFGSLGYWVGSHGSGSQ